MVLWKYRPLIGCLSNKPRCNCKAAKDAGGRGTWGHGQVVTIWVCLQACLSKSFAWISLIISWYSFVWCLGQGMLEWYWSLISVSYFVFSGGCAWSLTATCGCVHAGYGCSGTEALLWIFTEGMQQDMAQIDFRTWSVQLDGPLNPSSAVMFLNFVRVGLAEKKTSPQRVHLCYRGAKKHLASVHW